MGSVFRHAAASFEPTATGVLLWTRLTGATEATWLIATDGGLDHVVAHGTATTDEHRDNTIVVDVGGLEPATTYFYRFEADGERSPVGRTRTLPVGPVDGLRIGLVACARYSIAPLGVYRALAEREVDVVVHLGDYLYEDSGKKGERSTRPHHECITQDDYRERMAQTREDTDCQALHLRHPMIVVLDDHDVADNCWLGGAKSHDPAVHGPWEARALAATRTRQEWVPSRLRDPDEPRYTWRSVAIGDLAELVILDTRLSGRDEQAGDGTGSDLHDPNRSLLGDEQRAWLTERAADTSRPWLLLVSGVVVNEVSLPLPGGRLLRPLLPEGYAAVDGKILHDDQWDGYPAERERLVRELDRRGNAGGRTVILSADIHSSWAFEGPRTAAGAPVAVEFTTPAVASKPMGHTQAPGVWRLLDVLVSSLEHVPWVEVSARGYGLLEVTPAEVRMEWWLVEATAEDPATDAGVGACFRTGREDWPPRLEATTPLPDPVRAPLPEPLPPRPADLDALRRSHRIHAGLSRAAGVAGPTAVAAAMVAMLRRRRQR